MPARLSCAHHAFRAACEPSSFASRARVHTYILFAPGTAAPQSRPRLRRPQVHSQPTSPSQQQQQHQQQLGTGRSSSSASSARWKTRQSADAYTKSSKLTHLKSRAAYKLLEINDKHKLFRPGQSVVDLGYAPGSWSQVAKNRVGEAGRVVGIDIIPVAPPRGVSGLQGNFLSEEVQGRVREFVREWKSEGLEEDDAGEREEEEEEVVKSVVERARGHAAPGAGVDVVEREEKQDTSAKRHDGDDLSATPTPTETEIVAVADETEEPLPAPTPLSKKEAKKEAKKLSAAALDAQHGRVVDVVLSDMCAPFPGLELSSWVNSVNRPYRRMMNTSGNPFRDHAGSIDLCLAALTFCYDTLMTGGHFLCKFYQGPEDKELENRMKKLFEKVHRIKPDSSRKESRESYFVGLRRKADVSKEDVLG